MAVAKRAAACCDAMRATRCAALCNARYALVLGCSGSPSPLPRSFRRASRAAPPVGYSVPLSCTSLSFGPVSATATRTRASASSAAPSTASAFTLRRSGV